MIRELNKDEEMPLELLLLADPSEKLVREYISRGKCFVLNLDRITIGTFVLIPTRPETVEIVNIAVNEDVHGQGYGKQLIRHAIENGKI